jgi:predicted RNA binding protein YcfA (HicA-like mRNA interferase family)
MTKLPSVNGRRVVQALQRGGFAVDRIVGSHYVLVMSGQSARTVTVPVHGGRDLKPCTLRAIIRQAGLTVDDFVHLL